MSEKKPHGVLSAVWFTWYGFVIAAGAMPDRTIFGLGVLLSFLPIEAIGVFRKTNSYDTLSEIATWVFRRLSKHRMVGRGFNALMLLVILTITHLLGRTAYDLSGSWPISLAMAGLVTIWLQDHWLRPDIHG